MKEYKKLQIIKHALQYYIERPEANSKDILVENRLLDEITHQVNELKVQFNIR